MPFIWINKGIRTPSVEDPEIKTPKIFAIKNEKVQSQTLPGDTSFASRLAQHKYRQVQHALPEPHKVILAHEIMSSPVITLPLSATLSQAWALIRNNRFRHIPIVNSEGFPVGILSDRNLLREVVALGRDIDRRDDVGDPTPTIENLVSEAILTALPQTEIQKIAKTLFEHHIGAMPIIDEQNRLVGIITRSDILRALVHLGPLELWT
ncbi:MAG: CBS domain-containing protein [Candidatus Ozemobacteraceae bacterium]